MTGRYLVARAGEADLAVPAAFAGHTQGFGRWAIVGEAAAVHTGFGICALEPGGGVDAHVHSFEESLFLLEGSLVLDTAEGSVLLAPGDYGLVPVGVPHAVRNPGPEPARWADMCAPQPRARFGDDTFFVPPLAAADPVPVDVRDPRTRAFGHIDPANMDPGRQTQDQLAVSASMRTALLVYSGITVKMMVDSDLGAQLQTMFMVQYEPGGKAGTHDHPLEETYLVLEGEVDASFDGDVHRLSAGDVAWAGVGCVHGFSNPADRPVRWLETQAPQPPARHSYRFTRDWDYLRDALA
ncbi:MAG TPA: cupin domain-containing protein [Actinomycetota bacterium]|nr:cupin domain-containing protein [Actinomycetota bacterium]